MCRGESPRERVKPMGAGPSQMPEEGQVPFPLLLKRFGETHRHGEGAGPQSVGVVFGIRAMGNGEQGPDQG